MSKKTTEKWSDPDFLTALLGNSLFALCLFIVSQVAIVAFFPRMPTMGLDPSWVLAVGQALETGLVFGKDIIFTYGPYSAIATKAFHPVADSLTLFGSICLGVSFFIAAYLNFKHLVWYLQLAFLVVLSTVVHSMDPLMLFYPLMVGVYFFRIVVIEEAEEWSLQAWFLLSLVLFAPLGLLPLIKGSYLFSTVAIEGIAVLLLVLRSLWKQAAFIALVPIVAMVAFWLLTGQPIDALPLYFYSMLPIISGYTDAMSMQGSVVEIIVYLVAAVAIVSIVFSSVTANFVERLLLIGLFSATLFLAFKAGFVRHDAHAITSGEMILLVALLSCVFLSTNQKALVLCLAVCAWGMIDKHYVKTSSQSLFNNAVSTYVNAWTGLRTRWFEPDTFPQVFQREMTKINQQIALPKLAGTSDLYTVQQADLIASENAWNPRPIIQSYSAYTPSLAEKNKQHLQRENAPNNVFFKLDAIDNRLPTLADGASWPVLLSRYQPVAHHRGYLILQQRVTSRQAPSQEKLLSTRRYALGESFVPPDYDDALFVKINIQHSLLGKLANLLFKSSQLSIKVTLENGQEHTHRFISGMARSGFILSPYVKDISDYIYLNLPDEYRLNNNVTSVTIEADQYPLLWQDKFDIQFFAINYPRHKKYLSFFSPVLPRAKSPVDNLQTHSHCVGTVDNINDKVSKANLSISSLLKVRGWLASSTKISESAEQAYVVLTDPKGKQQFIKTQRQQRQDVGAHFNNNNMTSAGFTVLADVSHLTGKFSLGLAYEKANIMYQCSLALPIFIHQ